MTPRFVAPAANTSIYDAHMNARHAGASRTSANERTANAACTDMREHASMIYISVC